MGSITSTLLLDQMENHVNTPCMSVKAVLKNWKFLFKLQVKQRFPRTTPNESKDFLPFKHTSDQSNLLGRKFTLVQKDNPDVYSTYALVNWKLG